MTILGSTLSTADIASANLSDVSTSATPEIARLGFGGPAGSTARITLPATASLAGGIDFGGTASLRYQAAGHLRMERPSGGASTFQINADTSQVSNLSFSEAGTEKWQIRRLTTNDLSVLDVPASSRTLLSFLTTGRITAMGTPDDPSGGAIRMSQSAAMDGTGGATNIRLMMNQASFANGTNGVRGDDVTSTGTALGSGASFMLPIISQHVYNTKGALVAFKSDITVDKPSGATFPNSYSEAVGMASVMKLRGKGQYGNAVELNVFGYNTSTGNSDSGPAKLAGIRIGMVEDNTYASHVSASVHGTTSIHYTAGSIGLSIDSQGTQVAGTGIAFHGAAGYKRLIVGTLASSGFDFFCVDGTGNIGVRRSTNQSTTLAAALTVGYTSAGAASTSTADGINFGGDVNLYRSAATPALRTDSLFVANAGMNCNNVLNMNGTGGNGNVAFLEQASAPGAASNIAKVYAQDNGSSKTQLMVRFATGAAVQIAIEP